MVHPKSLGFEPTLFSAPGSNTDFKEEVRIIKTIPVRPSLPHSLHGPSSPSLGISAAVPALPLAPIHPSRPPSMGITLGVTLAPFVAVESPTNALGSVDVGFDSAPSLVDLDGDGDLDVVIGENYGTLKFYENTGSATSPSFLEKTGTENPFNGFDVGNYSTPSFVDLEGDGDLDAIVGEKYGTLKFFENTGTFTDPIFIERTETANPFNGVDVGDYSAPSFVDIDGDFDADALIGNEDGNLRFFENTGTPTDSSFIERTESANPFNGVDVGAVSSPTWVDIDGDSDQDLFVGDQGGKINFFENTGNASSPTFTKIIGSANPFNGQDLGYSSTPSFGDIEGDGDIDAFVGEKYGTIGFFENSKIPRFEELEGDLDPFPDIITGRFPVPTVSDIDNDGDLEGIFGNRDGQIRYYRNDGGGEFTEQNSVPNPFNSIDVGDNSSPAFGDLDGDGDEDLLIGNLAGTLSYFRRDGMDSFTQLTGRDNPFNSLDVGSGAGPALGDIDGDGDRDLVISESGGTVRSFRNDGAGSFVPQLGRSNPFDGFNFGVLPRLTFHDVDGDGDRDLVVGNEDGVIRYFPNDQGRFTEATGGLNPFSSVNVGQFSAPVFNDFDDDGDFDLGVGDRSGNLLVVANATI